MNFKSTSARRRARRRERLTLLALVGPALVLFTTLVLAPIVIAAVTSLTDWNGYVTAPMTFIGLDNFSELLNDEVVQDDLIHMIVLIVLSLGVQLPLALGLAILLNQPLRGRAIYRLLFFAPYVLSEVTTAVLFRMVLSPGESGLANAIVGFFGSDGPDNGWLADPDIVLYSVFFVITWKYFGFYMILLLAGRQSIPSELGEAAAMDGAGSWQTFWRVTFPLLGPTIRISVFLSIIGTVQLFDMVWVLTNGGPNGHSATMAISMYEFGFESSRVGYASAISMAMFFISFIFALGYQRMVLRRDTDGAITAMRRV